MYIYSTDDGRLIRFTKPMSLVNCHNVISLRQIPHGEEDYDLLTPATAEILKQAERESWLPPKEAIAERKPKSYQNFCIRLDNETLIRNRIYMPVGEFLATASFEEKKVTISRIAHQLSFCHIILSLQSCVNPKDVLTPATGTVLNKFFNERCLLAQQRYVKHSDILPMDRCVYVNDSIYIRVEGEYKKLSSFLMQLNSTDANQVILDLSHLAASLHSIITEQETVA